MLEEEPDRAAREDRGMLKRIALVQLLTLIRAAICPAQNLTITTFNIQTLGKTKIKKSAVTGVLVPIMRKYDLVALQEIKDKGQTTPHKFLDLINAAGTPYGLLLSERTGRREDDKSSMEQYG